MEHGTVASPLIDAAVANLSHTYLVLGRSTFGAHVWEEEGFKACAGTVQHPICNFATDLRVTASAARRLREIAERNRTFTLYLLPPHDNENSHNLLSDEGFGLSHKLKIMVAAETLEDDVQLDEALLKDDRRKIAEFMVDQFFHRQSTAFRRGIAEATAISPELKLFRAVRNERTSAAVMLSEYSDIVGLYNLCVAPQFRRRGWGSAVVKTVVGEARKGHRSVTLQCEPSLMSWYSSLGFKEVGSVSVYGLCRFREIDIMN